MDEHEHSGTTAMIDKALKKWSRHQPHAGRDMKNLNRREFTSGALAALAGAALGRPAAAAPQAGLPTVRWGKFHISRVLVGHNPFKGISHFSPELSKEMREYFSSDSRRGPELLRRCQQLGINTWQGGSEICERILREFYASGGAMQWIPTFYSQPGKGKAELARILAMDPKPIAVQHFGGTTDSLYAQGKMDQVLDTLKMLHDAGLMVGLCSHRSEALAYAADKGWELDFYQCCFYRVSSSLKPPVKNAPPRPRGEHGEIYEDEARQAMVKFIRQVSQPCIAFKVLAGNRHCSTARTIQAALRFAYQHIKPTDVVLLGMWQKYKDQVAENVACIRQILGVA